MLKIENKFIIFIISLIILIISFGVFNSYYNKKIDRSSNILLVNGEAKLNNKSLELNKKQILNIGDTVETIGNEALAILEWGDGSITRLGGNSSIKIKEMYLSDDLNTINISFELLSGKTWSNVISFLGESSYFKEYFRDSEAAIRGTVFNVDLDNEYLYVTNHKVTLTTNDGENIIINENNPLNLTTFSFIALEDFIKFFKDKTWENLNITIDEEFINSLKDKLNQNLDKLNQLNNVDFKSLSELEKQKLYNKLLTDYQNFNFVKPDNADLFKAKLELKNKLIMLADDNNKTILLENTLNDFNDIINLKEYGNVDPLLSILSDNKELLKNIDINNFLNNEIISENLKNIMINNFSNLQEIFINKFDKVRNLNIGIDSIKNVENKANGLIHEGLDTLFKK